MSAEPCPRCGEALPPTANFCPNCGAPVSVPVASERRVVTVVFVDLAGSTELAAQLDPERYREVVAAFHGMVSEEIAWYGGVAEGFIGDAVLGVFGVKAARDDDAVRAIRAAIDIRAGAERLGRELGLARPMQVRIGVNTGAVAVGTATDRNIVIGAEVNVGARLQQAATPGEILAGPTTVLLASGAVEFGEVRELAAKGFEGPLRARPVVAVTERARADRTRIPFVNRRRELRLLLDTFDRAATRERAHLVTIYGEPGIGKSRVVDEFVADLPAGTRVLSGHSSPFEEEFTFLPLAQMVYRHIGAERGAPEDEVLGRLRASAAGWVEGEDVDRAVRQLGHTLGLGEEGTEENRYHAAEVRRGVLTMLTGLAKEGPIVLVFEDLHVADPLLLDLIEQLVREARRLPLLVVCVARWEVLQDRPGWSGGLADTITLWLEPLAPAHAARLATEAGGLEPERAERIAQHTGGNPFFILEVTGMLLREERDLPPLGPASSTRLLPATVQSVIAARIDQLTPVARELVRRASVFPRGRFDEDELALLVDPKPELLAEAEDEELLVRDEERPGVWSFRSDVLRDVAYESLAKRERQRLHLRVANRLGEEPETAERYPRTIAFHLEQAARAALDLNPGDRNLAERAVEALSNAGDLARRRMESRTAADLYERALALAGPEDGWGGREAWALSMLGEARYWLGAFDAAEDALRRSLPVADDDPRIEAHAARFLGDISLSVHGDEHLAAALFERSLAAARQTEDPWVLARTLLMAAWMPFWRSQLDEAEAMFGEALEVSRSGDRRDAWGEVRSLVGLATVTSVRGDENDALALALEALGIAHDAGQAFTEAIAQQAVAASLRRLLRLHEALEHAEASIRMLRELGARWELASSLGERGEIHRASGRLEEAETDLREALILCGDLAERSLVLWIAARLAETLALRGDVASASAVLADPRARTTEGEPGGATSISIAESVISLAAGDPEAARAKALAAVKGSAEPMLPNLHAAAVWFVGMVFDVDLAGGDEAVEQARELLERNGWRQALREPDLVHSLV